MRIDYVLGLALLGQTLITTYGEAVRKKRDMVAIGNFIRNLFGLGYQEPVTRFIINRPSYIPNYELNNIYRTPFDNQIYVRNIPAYAISDLRNIVSRNIISPGYVVNEPQYIYRPEISPLEYNPTPLVYQFNRPEPMYNLEKYDSSNNVKPSVVTYSEVPPPISEDTQKDRDSVKIVREKEVLQQPPMYIQNSPLKIPIMPARMEQTVVTERNVITPPKFHFFNYPIERVVPRKPVRIYTNEKPKQKKPSSPKINENTESIAVPSRPILAEDKENKMYAIPEKSEKIVKLTESRPFEYNHTPLAYQFNRPEPTPNLENYYLSSKVKPSGVTFSEIPPPEDKQKIVRETEALPQPPMYIQNGPQVLVPQNPVKIPIMPARVDQTVVTERNVIAPLNFGEVNVFKYPIERVFPQDPVKIYKNEKPVQIEPLPANINENTESIAVPNRVIIAEDKENNMFATPETLQKIAKFTKPVRTRFIYKSINHNQPHKNSVIKFDNMLADIDEDKVSSTNRPHIADSKVSLSPHYFFIPPFNTEEPPFVQSDSTEQMQENVNPLNDINKIDQSQKSFGETKKLTPEESYASRVLDFIKNNYTKEGRRGDIPELSH